MGWVVMGSRPCVFIRDSYEKGKRHVRDIKAYQVQKDRQLDKMGQVSLGLFIYAGPDGTKSLK